MRKFVLALAGVMFLVLSPLLVSPALGHAEVLGTSPADRSTVGGKIERIDIAFGEPVSLGKIDVVGPSGSVPGDMMQTQGLVIAFNLAEEISEEGEYTVTYEFDSLDGDFVILEYKFTYDADSPPPIAVVATVEEKGGGGAIAIGLLSACTVALVGLLAWRYSKLSSSES